MFDLMPLTAPFAVIVFHVATACIALVVGPFAIYRRRRDRLHRGLGYVWVLAIAMTALSSFLIEASVLPIAFGMGAIHLLSIWALWTIWFGVQDARAGRIAAHRARMAGLYWQGLSIAGVLTFLPGRALNAALFGDAPYVGLWVIGVGLAALLWVNLRSTRQAPDAPARRATMG